MPCIKSCETCGTRFISKSYRNIYCSRKCFKTAYHNAMKVTQHPSFICPECGAFKKLDFHPKSSFNKWKKFKCDCCGYKPFTDLVD
jgi:hypothetical protein